MSVKKAAILVLLLGACLQGPAGTPTQSHIEGLQLTAQRPRIWVDRSRLDWLRRKYRGVSVSEVAAEAGPSATGRALTYLITGDKEAGRAAIRLALGGAPASQDDLYTSDEAQKREAIQPPAAQSAVVYDWCHSLLTGPERAALQTNIVSEARSLMSNGRLWRSFHNTGHTSTWPVTAAAIALHGDDPFAEDALAFLRPEIADALRTFDTLFGDGEWCEGVDYNRHSTFPALRTLLALKTATGRDLLAGSPHFRNAGLYVLYFTKPDGLVLPADDNDWPYLGHWEHVGLLMLNSEFRDGYVQHFLNTCPVEQFALPADERWAQALWYDRDIPAKDPQALPPSRLFRGKGLLIARSGWGWDSGLERSPDTWLSFHCGDYFGDHAHYDINSFEIYHRGELAIDSGRYDADWDIYDDPEKLRQSQFFNYYQRTVAHNTVLVYDPAEKFEMGVVNDGGQIQMLFQGLVRNAPEDYAQGSFPSDSGRGSRDWSTNPGRWETGDITAYMATRDFTFVRGDGTKAYSAGKMRSFVRQLLFLPPNVIVVFDRVVSTRKDFKKTWLLHSIREPLLAPDGSRAVIDYGDGGLTLVPILPERKILTPVGGPGKEFLAGGIAFQCCRESPIHHADLHYGELPGGWRLEESPEEKSEEDYFLNILYTGPRGAKSATRVEVLEKDPDRIKLRITEPSARVFIVNLAKCEKPAVGLQIKSGDRLVYDGTLPDRVVLEEGRP